MLKVVDNQEYFHQMQKWDVIVLDNSLKILNLFKNS